MPNLCDKESYDCNDLIKIVGILRSPEGCPWDRAQDHHTIRNNFLEEAYEAVEAIDLESSALLREEPGRCAASDCAAQPNGGGAGPF